VARPDYANVELEQIWVADESTFNVLAQPAVTDAVIPLPGVSLPSVLVERVPTTERQQTQGVRNTVARKKIPSNWSIPLYGKYGAAAGTPPSWGLLAAKGFGLQTITGGVSVGYTLVDNISEKTVSIWHWVDNMIRGFRGCLVNTALLELSGGDEPKLTFGGFALNEVFAGPTQLDGAIDNSQTTMTVDDADRIQVGPAATDGVRMQIETEVVLVTAIDYITRVATIVRAQAGSSAAAHADNTLVDPWRPGADTDPADTIAPLTLGDVNLAAPLTSMRVISVSSLLDNGMEPRMTEYAQGVSTGYRRAKRRAVTGELKAHLRAVNQAILTDLKRDLERNVVLTSGDAATARLRVTLAKLKFLSEQITVEGPEFGITAPYQGFESSSGNDEVSWLLD
jgi:hypothetical protein